VGPAVSTPWVGAVVTKGVGAGVGYAVGPAVSYPVVGASVGDGEGAPEGEDVAVVGIDVGVGVG
jgi:hypothetical protein